MTDIISERQPARIEEVEIGRIRDDGGAQMRVEMRPETIDEYATDLLNGATFPAIVVFDDGAALWLADGYHRAEATRKIERKTILAEIRPGSRRDAILFGCGANSDHGLKRSSADKRRAIERLLKDPEWAKWSDRKIAEATKTDHKTVASVRRELTSGEIPTASGKPVGKKAGEIPTASGKPDGKKAGEIPTASGKPDTSLVADLLKTLSDSDLIAECERRGFAVGASHVAA